MWAGRAGEVEWAGGAGGARGKGQGGGWQVREVGTGGGTVGGKWAGGNIIRQEKLVKNCEDNQREILYNIFFFIISKDFKW